MDVGTFTVKDLVYAAVFLGALVLGHRKVWAWYYQLEDVKASCAREVAALRLELEKAEKRESEWKQLVWERRELLWNAIAIAKERSIHPPPPPALPGS